MELDGQGGITAILGPTNTGKTHRAVERMLQFGTGTSLWTPLACSAGRARASVSWSQARVVVRHPPHSHALTGHASHATPPRWWQIRPDDC